MATNLDSEDGVQIGQHTPSRATALRAFRPAGDRARRRRWRVVRPVLYRRRNTGLSRFIDGQQATPPITARHEEFMPIYRGPGHPIPRLPWRQAAVAAASRHRDGGT